MVYKLLTLLFIWATWRLVVDGWKYRYRGGSAIFPEEPIVIILEERLPSRRDPLVTNRNLFPRMGNYREKGAAHVFGMCLL